MLTRTEIHFEKGVHCTRKSLAEGKETQKQHSVIE